jgi:hypothetical protein
LLEEIATNQSRSVRESIFVRARRISALYSVLTTVLVLILAYKLATDYLAESDELCGVANDVASTIRLFAYQEGRLPGGWDDLYKSGYVRITDAGYLGPGPRSCGNFQLRLGAKVIVDFDAWKTGKAMVVAKWWPRDYDVLSADQVRSLLGQIRTPEGQRQAHPHAEAP